jgi:quercetin dioxygenase-like cupin family protein
MSTPSPCKTLIVCVWALSVPLGGVLAQPAASGPQVVEARSLPPPGKETVVAVHLEPFHKLVYEGGEFQVLDIEIPPGDTTRYHLHEAPMFYVSVSASHTDAQVLGGRWLGGQVLEEPEWLPGEVDSNTSYARRPLAHRVKNLGSTPFRLIGVVNKHQHPRAPGTEDSLPGTMEIQNDWFRQSRAMAEPGRSLLVESRPYPVVVVQAGSGSARVRVGGGQRTSFKAIGDFAVIEPGQEFEAANGTDAPLPLVFIAVQ